MADPERGRGSVAPCPSLPAGSGRFWTLPAGHAPSGRPASLPHPPLRLHLRARAHRVTWCHWRAGEGTGSLKLRSREDPQDPFPRTSRLSRDRSTFGLGFAKTACTWVEARVLPCSLSFRDPVRLRCAIRGPGGGGVPASEKPTLVRGYLGSRFRDPLHPSNSSLLDPVLGRVWLPRVLPHLPGARVSRN